MSFCLFHPWGAIPRLPLTKIYNIRSESRTMSNLKVREECSNLKAYCNARVMCTYRSQSPASVRYLVSQNLKWFYLPVYRKKARICLIQTQNGAEALFSKIANSGVYRAEEPCHRVLILLVGEDGKQAAHVDTAKSDCEETGNVFRTSAEFSMAEDIIDKAREKLDKRVKVGEEKMLRKIKKFKNMCFNFQMCLIYTIVIIALLTMP